MKQTANLRVKEMLPLIPPRELEAEIPITERAVKTVLDGRRQVVDILQRKDSRLLAVVGPCSIHDEKAALEYATRIKTLADDISDRVFIVMRVYFEKPRTALGWKGFISDPHLDGSLDMITGLRRARKLLLQINELGVSAGTELLDPIIPQYIADLVTWAAIGARTTESQTHREMCSGLSMPVGYKNATDGDIDVAINAIKAALAPHSFIGIDMDGKTCVIRTTGNSDGHVVLRGGRSGANFDPTSLQKAAKKLADAGLCQSITIDCSHDNSGKIARNQELVCKMVLAERLASYDTITGIMLESNINEGSQPICSDLSKLRYGVSVTDECMGWEQTETLLRWVHSELG